MDKNTDYPITKDLCKARTTLVNEAIKNLETRVFEVMKKQTQVSDMAHTGHKEALNAAIESLQKDLDYGSNRFDIIDKTISNLGEHFASITDDLEDDLENALKLFKEDIKDLKAIVASNNTDLLLMKQTVKLCDDKAKQARRISIALVVVFILFLINKGDMSATYDAIIKLIF